MTTWKLQLLGSFAVLHSGNAFTLERKSAALFAYLALAGATTRSRLAGLLWPEAGEATARNNLAQTLSRLRRQTGEVLLVGQDRLELAVGAEVDAHTLRRTLLAGQGECVLEHPGELLGGFDYDDLPDFAEWLWSEREKMEALWAEAAFAVATASEAKGAYDVALRQMEALLRRNSLLEAGYRRVMRLNYLLGDRAAALKAYQRCERLLADELGIEPLPETQELMRRLGRDDAPPPTLQTRELPPEVLRPPHLIGREAAWQMLEEAWDRRLPIYITGEPGVGKTRLARDFVASKGRALYLLAQPGEQYVPFASAASLARARLAAAREVALPDWVQLELSRLLPELRRGEAPPMRGEEDRLHFFQAYAEMVKLTGVDFIASISDDVQYYDAATVELGAFITSQRGAVGELAIPRYVIIYRRGDLLPATQAVVDRFVASGMAARIDLEPLDENATASLVASVVAPLNPSALSEAKDSGPKEAVSKDVRDALPAALYRRTGGNPLFLLETLRSLLETDRLAAPVGALPATEKVDGIVRQRLTRLSPTALRVAQAAAVLQSELSPLLVGEMLQLSAHDHLSAWEELEQAQILTAGRFSHDLVFEAVSAGISPSVRVLLERRAAEVLSARPVEPLRVARHFIASGDALAGAPWFRAAAHRALAQLRLDDARAHFDEVVRILSEFGDEEGLAQAIEERDRALTHPST